MADKAVTAMLIFKLDKADFARARKELDAIEAGLEDVGKEADQAKDKVNRLGSKGGAALGKLRDMVILAQAGFEVLQRAAGTAMEMIVNSVGGLRVERAFYALANQVGQSGEDILAAMRRASNGVIDNATLMQKANTALQLGVAKTPEDFEKLTRAAVSLGAAVGQGPVESLDNLINAAGRRSTEVLDNLGISLSAVNMRMEEIAQSEFGLPVSKLDAAQTSAAFMAATLDVANQKAAALGGNMADLGTGIESNQAGWANLKQELGEILAIGADLVNLVSETVFGKTIFDQMTDGAKAWQVMLLESYALLMATVSQAVRGIEIIGRVANGKMSVGDAFNALKPEAIKESFQKSYGMGMDWLEKRFGEVLNPAKAAGKGGSVAEQPPATAPENEAIDDAADAATEAMDKLAEAQGTMAQQSADAVKDSTRQQMEALEDAAEKREDMARDNARKIADIERDYAKSVVDAARDMTEEEAQLALDFARETADQAKAEAQAREDIERDHQRRLRDIETGYAESAEDAIRNQDAIALLKAQQQRDTDLAAAEQSRRDNLDDAAESAKTERETLAEERARKLADAQTANAQKLADLQQSLNDELEANRLKYEQEMSDQSVAEARKRADLQQSLAQRLADLRQGYLQENADLQQSLDGQLAIMKKYEIDKTKLMIDAAMQRAQSMAGLFQQLGGAALGGNSNNVTFSQTNNFPSGVNQEQLTSMVQQQTTALLERYARG